MSRRLLLLSSWLLVPTLLHANDGADRYQHHGIPNLLVHFPEPSGDASGYRFLAGDAAGGADGEPEFRWAQPHAVAAVRIAAFETTALLGPAKEPMAIFDTCAENGDTPIDWKVTPPRGRHPGGSHDGGLNLDLGYALRSLQGRVFSPDYAACTEHFDTGADGKPVDAHQCRGPADRLDEPRQALFYLQLFRINREDFDLDLLDEVGIDLKVREAVLSVLHGWAREERYGATPEVIADMERTFTSDRWEGWEGSHHHHTHVRFRDVDLHGRNRKALEKLLGRERGMDGNLGAAGAKDPLVWRVRLWSQGLERALEFRLLPLEQGIREARYRVKGGPWVTPDPSGRHQVAVLDLPAGPQLQPAVLDLEAEAVLVNGERRQLSRRLVLPRQDPRLHVSVEPARLQPKVVKQGRSYALELQYPAVYAPYVTEVRWEVFRGGAPESVPGKGAAFAAAVVEDAKQPVQLIRARVLLAGRKAVVIPVVVP